MVKNKYFIINFIALIVSVLLIAIIFLSGFEKKYNIILDNRCTKDENQVEEENKSFEIINRFYKLLSSDKKFNVKLTCDYKNAVYLEERVDIINKINPDLVINVEVGDVSEIYISSKNKESLKFSKVLSNNTNLESYYYYIPFFKGDIRKVVKISSNEKANDMPTLKIFEDVKSNIVILSLNDNDKLDELIYKSIKEYFNLD